MPDPDSGLYDRALDDPTVCVSLDGRVRYSDFCECGVVDDLRRRGSRWLCRSCRAEPLDDEGE